MIKLILNSDFSRIKFCRNFYQLTGNLFIGGLILFSILFLNPNPVSGKVKNFNINSTTTYAISSTGNTLVRQRVQIENLSEYLFSSSYSIQLAISNLASIKAWDSQGELKTQIKAEKDHTIVTVFLRDRVVGVGKETEFSLTYESDQLAYKKGSIWIVDIPGLLNEQDFDSFDISLTIPKDFGQAKIMKPNRDLGSNLKFSKKEAVSGIYLAFGEYQYYNFDISYYLSNSNLFPINAEIAIPSSRAPQEVAIDSISPPPVNVYQDEDGNWMAVYKLSPNQKYKTVVKGVARIGIEKKEQLLTELDKKKYLSSQPFWEVDSSEIRSIAEKYSTAEQIYKYTVDKLSYNYDKVINENSREGALGAIKNPSFAACLEFTDLFISVARAAGIPARQIEGYAYTQNEKLKPLGLVKDILHSWPEYYDEENKVWIMVDPTWGDTTHGMDYFNSFDFDHLSFVVKGISSTYPLPPGSYKKNFTSRDITVKFASENDFKNSSAFQVESNISDFILSGFPISGRVLVRNKGNILLSSQNLIFTNTSSGYSKKYNTTTIPPFGHQSIDFRLDNTPFLTSTENLITIVGDNYNSSKKIRSGFFVQDLMFYLKGGFVIVVFSVLFYFTRKKWRIHVL